MNSGRNKTHTQGFILQIGFFHSFDQSLQGELCSLFEPTAVWSLNCLKQQCDLWKEGTTTTIQLALFLFFLDSKSLFLPLNHWSTLHKYIVWPVHEEKMATAVLQTVRPVVLASLFSRSTFLLFWMHSSLLQLPCALLMCVGSFLSYLCFERLSSGWGVSKQWGAGFWCLILDNGQKPDPLINIAWVFYLSL
jgi:hypothetical protein